MMETECIYVNKVPTKVLSWGKRAKDANSVEENIHYIICIPGNPGVTEFYTEFLEELHKKTNNTVWVIGHAGHEIMDSHELPSPQENKDLYSLQGQVEHKILFLENNVPNNAKITLVGHSMGCYLILRLLQVPSIKSRVVKSYLLFPTIEHMATTKNGVFLTFFLKYFSFLLLPLVFLFNLFPLTIQMFLLRVYCKLDSIPENYIDIIRNFIKPHTVRNSTSMAYDEMLHIKDRNNEAIKENLELIKLYYGATDGWTPLSYYVNIKKDIPGIDAQICDKGFAHAFVLRASKPVAHMLASWIEVQ